MAKRMRGLLGLGLALCLMLPLLAQVGPGEPPGAGGPAAGEQDTVVIPRVQFIDFRQVTITGTLTMPSSSYYLLKSDAKFDCLIPVRADMLPEMVRSVENL